MKKALLLLLFALLKVCPSSAQGDGPFIYDDKKNRNPFLPLVDQEGRYLSPSRLSYAFDNLTLSGILWDAQGGSTALINNQVLRVGESVSGFRVKEITPNSVILFKDGREISINLSLGEEK